MAHISKAAKQRPLDNPAPAAAGAADADAVRQQIELRAYQRYCERGCADGAAQDDWLAAEQEVLAGLESATTAAEVSEG